ncbi:hypothetical protein GKU49_21435, partial [Salmonella enterica]|nr:hypothetical protein [Salmonella enterica]
GFPRKKFYHEENILENQIIHSSLPFCHARFLKSTNFTLSSLVLALSLYSNIVHASEIQSNDATQYGLLPISAGGSNSVSFGAHTFTGNNSTAVGQQASAGHNSTAIGSFSYANDGSYSTAVGDDARATGDSSTALGERTRATGKFSTAIGSDSKAISSNSTATGQGSRATGDLSTATGQGAQATGNGSTATGQSAQATGNGSTATGQSAQAKGKNSVALGANSVADKDNQVSIGQKITDATTGAVSYITRTLSNLTDGTDAHDAVNKGQLDTAKASAISEANKHTDDEIGKLDTKAQGYATTAQSEAEKYTDNAKSDAISTANKHTDDEIGKLDTKAQGYATTAQTAANKYTDDTAKKTLKTASENTERRALIAENNAVTRSNTYTDESSSRTLESANTYTNHRAVQAENNAVARSNTYTDNRFGELRKSLQHTEKRLNAGIAGVTAIASIPYVAENSFSYGIGLGNYQNGKALAAGVQYKTSPNTNIRLNVSWDSAGNTATGVGLSGGW